MTSFSPAPIATSAVNAGDSPLTSREYQILIRLAQGKSTVEIAAELFLAKDTIKSHLWRMFRKLEARNRAHLVAIGYDRHLLPPVLVEHAEDQQQRPDRAR